METPTRADIEQAAKLIEEHEKYERYIEDTSILNRKGLDAALGAHVSCVMENEQTVGSFKARGAMHAVLALSEDEKDRGVVTHSSGNHGQALAWAGYERDVPVTVVVPRNAPRVKVEGMERWRPTIVECEPTQQAREETVAQIARETGAVVIPPYNDRRIIVGQATAAKEMLEDMVVPPDAIVVPVGGGGLLSGTLAAVHAYEPHVKVYAAEPEEADDAKRSLQTGVLQGNDPKRIGKTLADGLRMSLGDKTFAIIARHMRAEDIILVDNEEILEAMRLVRDHLGVLIEPSSATAFAAVKKYPDLFRGKHVGIIVSGENVDEEVVKML